MDKKDSTAAQKAGKRKKALRLRHAKEWECHAEGKTDVDLHSESPHRGWRNMGRALLKSIQAYLDNLRQET